MPTANAVDLRLITTVLLDADGTLVPSEEPAFVASAGVTEAFAGRYGLTGDFSPEHLRRTTTGKNFRTTAQELLGAAGVAADPAELERWVDREKDEVIAYLAQVLRPRPDVIAALADLGRRYRLAVVSSSALSRLEACFTAAGLIGFLPASERFSAEDSLPTPTSKPDPAVYKHALHHLGAGPSEAVAVEDSVPGATSAVAAGVATIGLVQFVPPAERDQRVQELRDAGVVAVVDSWAGLTELLGRDHQARNG